jgi:hypothetical protein
MCENRGKKIGVPFIELAAGACARIQVLDIAALVGVVDG